MTRAAPRGRSQDIAPTLEDRLKARHAPPTPGVGARALRRAAVAATGIALLTLLISCIPGRVRMRLETTSDTNEGRPFYVVVQATDTQSYLTATYDIASTLVMQPDDNVLATAMVYPGQARWVRVKLPPDTDVAIFALYTQPGRDWKRLIPAAEGREIHIRLGPNEITE